MNRLGGSAGGSSPRCPLCGEDGRKERVERHRDPAGAGEFEVLACGACGVQFAWPFKHPGADWYRGFSSPEGYDGSDTSRYRRFLGSHPGKGQRLLDVGCGAGAFLRLARDAGYDAVGIDLNESALEAARRGGATGVTRGDLESFLRAHPGARFDVVTLFDCLEHVDDPNRMMDQVRAALSPRGRVVITVPNARRPMLFGRDLFDQPPHHLTRWTLPALRGFLERRGFSIEEMDASRLPTWEFSRRPIGWCTALALAAAKRALFGGARSKGRTVSELVSEDPTGVPAGLADRGARARLVAGFQGGLHALSFPLFVCLTLGYKAFRRDCGVTLFALARKEGA